MRLHCEQNEHFKWIKDNFHMEFNLNNLRSFDTDKRIQISPIPPNNSRFLALFGWLFVFKWEWTRNIVHKRNAGCVEVWVKNVWKWDGRRGNQRGMKMERVGKWRRNEQEMRWEWKLDEMGMKMEWTKQWWGNEKEMRWEWRWNECGNEDELKKRKDGNEKGIKGGMNEWGKMG